VRGRDCKKSSPPAPPYTGGGSLRKCSPPTSRFDKGHVHDLVGDEFDVVVGVVVHRGVINPGRGRRRGPPRGDRPGGGGSTRSTCSSTRTLETHCPA
jgi:hypothetical protein